MQSISTGVCFVWQTLPMWQWIFYERERDGKKRICEKRIGEKGTLEKRKLAKKGVQNQKKEN